jgi:hypothetical protein
LLIAKLQPHTLDEIDERRAEEIDHALIATMTRRLR